MTSYIPPQYPATEGGPKEKLVPAIALSGTIHIYVAFDWGEELDLQLAQRLVPAVVHALPRRRRTPTSFAYRPPPLRVSLEPVTLELPEARALQVRAEATVFDFAAVSVALHFPIDLPAAALTRVADWLADPTPIVRTARSVLEPLYRQLLPALKNPHWQDDLSEEYFVFQMPVADAITSARRQGDLDGWLAGLVHLEAGPLSAEEIAEALHLHLSYGHEDLFIPDWGAAVLLDRDCDETLETIEFTNLQLLEYRHIDQRLDDSVATAYRLLHKVTQSWFPIWRTYTRPLRVVGELNVEANDLFERTGNAFKLVGDQYLARVYGLLAKRFHLAEWERGIRSKLGIIEGVYRVLYDQSATYRAEALEVTVIVLIIFEILMALRHG
jgi:hypothetical protein